MLLIQPAPADEKVPVEINKLTDRVYVCDVAAGKYFIPVIVSEEGLIIVDSTMYPSYAKQLRAKFKEKLGRDDYKYLINTHYHWDHTCGNQVFSDATVIAHEFTLEDMKKFTDDFQGFIDRRKEIFGKRGDENRVRLHDEHGKEFVATPPEKTFADKMKLELKDMNISLYHTGLEGAKPTLFNHTRSDIFIYIHDEKVLCVGDSYYKKEWLHTPPQGDDLELLNGFLKIAIQEGCEIEHVIFGHDPPISK
jgi:cyclase